MDPQEGGPAGPAWPCEGVCAPSMRRCSASSSVRRRGPGGGSGQGHAAHLGALRAPIGACRCRAGHRVALSAEVADVWEVGGRGPGVEAAKPEFVTTLVEGASELQQAGADAAQVVSVERFSAGLPARYHQGVPRGRGRPL